MGGPEADPSTPLELPWRRLHPLSPLLRGGLFLIVIAGIVITNLRDRLFELFFSREIVDAMGPNEGDVIDFLIAEQLLIWALVAILVVIMLIIGFSWLSWRFSTFRITAEAVESRRGVLFRQHRRAPLERIQSVNLQRSLLARVCGLTQVDVQTAGQGGKVELQYLGHREAKLVREQILLAAGASRNAAGVTAGGVTASSLTESGETASGVTAAGETAAPMTSPGEAPAGVMVAGGAAADITAPGETSTEMNAPAGTSLPANVQATSPTNMPISQGSPVTVDFGGRPYRESPSLLDERLRNIADFDIDPTATESGSLIKVPVPRLVASILLSSEMLIFVAVAVVVLSSGFWASPYMLAGLLPVALVMVSVLISQFNRGFNFALSRAADGVRVGAGLTATTTETIPFGRVHAVEARQPIGWRPFGWWKVRITTAGHSASQAGQNKLQNMVLPVGDINDVLRVFETLLHSGEGAEDRRAALHHALVGGGEGFLGAGPRAAWLLWFGTRRAGMRIEDAAEPHASLRIRRGWATRSLSVMPVLRAQSIQLTRPLVHRMLGLATLQAHTVLGPVRMQIRGLELDKARQAFDVLEETIVRVQGAEAASRAQRHVTEPPAAPIGQRDMEHPEGGPHERHES